MKAVSVAKINTPFSGWSFHGTTIVLSSPACRVREMLWSDDNLGLFVTDRDGGEHFIPSSNVEGVTYEPEQAPPAKGKKAA